MKNIILYLCIPFLLSTVTYPGEKGEYDVKKIPVGLRKESNLVIRKYIDEFQIINDKRAIHYHTEAYTIFGKDEQNQGEFVLHYNDSFWDVNYLEGYIYDANGKEIKELDDDDILDYSDFISYSLFTDIRIKHATLHHNDFPYTVEFKYKITYNGYLHWPDWYSRMWSSAVQLSRFVVKHSSDQELRYWCNSDRVEPDIKKDGRYKVYTWEAVNLPELPVDAISEADPFDYADYVLIGPTEFVLDGYKGNMNSWKEFGLWYNKLCSKQGELPKEAFAEIKKQYLETDNIYEKINKLYKYMQSRTRYISISLGIGGWQPFKASFVHEKGYGDCKALSNYMVSILKAAGITAYQVLIKSGPGARNIEEFCSANFNHVIVCVPMETDTVWLECTSQVSPYNQIGYSNENRMALVILPKGGKIVYTPASKPENNKQFHRSEIRILKDGSFETDTEMQWSGNQKERITNTIVSAAIPEKPGKIISLMNVPNVNIKDFYFVDEGFLILKIKAELPRYGSASGNRLFFKPNLTEKRTNIPKDIKRLSPVKYLYPFADSDTIFYHIPTGYKIEAFPEEVSLVTSFGRYEAKCTAAENIIIYTRFYEINDYNIPASLYAEYRKFIADMVKADRAQVVLSKE
jgi:hypothetical protein